MEKINIDPKLFYDYVKLESIIREVYGSNVKYGMIMYPCSTNIKECFVFINDKIISIYPASVKTSRLARVTDEKAEDDNLDEKIKVITEQVSREVAVDILSDESYGFVSKNVVEYLPYSRHPTGTREKVIEGL